MQTAVPLNPEEELIVDCARRSPIRAACELDWSRVLRVAAEHRVTPLLDSNRLLPDAAKHLQSGMLQRTRWNLLLAAELLHTLEILERYGISAVPFKGPVMAQTLYGDPALRDSCDLDLLVRQQDIRRVAAILIAQGYTTDLPSDERGQEAYIRTRYELHFTSPRNGIPIEIHQSFVPPSYCLNVDYDGIWGRMERTPFFERQVLTLAPADLLLMLCIHGAKHEWRELINIADIARLLEKPGTRWRLPDGASSGAARLIRVGLLLARQVLDAPLAPNILKECERDNTAVRLAEQARSRLFTDTGNDSLFRSHIWFIRSRERLRDRIAACLSLAWVPTEKDYAVMNVPKSLSLLYFPLHALRMIQKYTLAVMRSAVSEWS